MITFYGYVEHTLITILIRYNLLTYLEGELLKPLTSLLALYINVNQLQTLPPYLGNLRVLDISNNIGINNLNEYRDFVSKFYSKYFNNHRYSLKKVDGMLASVSTAVDTILEENNVFQQFVHNMTDGVIPAMLSEIVNTAGDQSDAIGCVEGLVATACEVPGSPLWCEAVKLAVDKKKKEDDEIKCHSLVKVLESQLEEAAASDAIDLVDEKMDQVLPNFTSSILFSYESLQLRATGLPVICEQGYGLCCYCFYEFIYKNFINTNYTQQKFTITGGVGQETVHF
eukprot:m.89691 g.89691  ORF g.89691 m.89691 type:complete len:284 (-) comp13235_c0_seq2:1672-2523(-)